MNQNRERMKEALLSIFKLDVITSFKRFLEGELSIMLYLYSNYGDKVNPSEIAKNLNITKGRVTALLSSLIDKEYIKMSLDNNDRRKLNVSLTELGLTEINKEINSTDKYIDDILNKMGDEKTEELITTLHYISQKAGE